MILVSRPPLLALPPDLSLSAFLLSQHDLLDLLGVLLDGQVEFALVLVQLVLKRGDIEGQLFFRTTKEGQLDVQLGTLGLEEFHLGGETTGLIEEVLLF